MPFFSGHLIVIESFIFISFNLKISLCFTVPAHVASLGIKTLLQALRPSDEWQGVYSQWQIPSRRFEVNAYSSCVIDDRPDDIIMLLETTLSGILAVRMSGGH